MLNILLKICTFVLLSTYCTCLALLHSNSTIPTGPCCTEPHSILKMDLKPLHISGVDVKVV